MRSSMAILAALFLAGPTFGQVLIYDFPLDEDPGWPLEGQWAFGQPAGQGGLSGGGPDPTSGHTGDNVYGYNLDGDYPDNMPQTYWLVAGPFDFRAFTNVELHFYRWLGVEDSRNDHARLEISNDGTEWAYVWRNWPG